MTDSSGSTPPQKTNSPVIFIACAIVAVVVVVILVFGKTKPDPPKPVDADYLVRMQCLSCHSLKGTGGGQAPSLDGVGAKFTKLRGSKTAARTFFLNHLNDPETYPGTGAGQFATSMPAFTHLGPHKLEALADYLADLE